MNDLSTIDKLVEFGMGTALATQMIQTMNQAMAQTRVAGVNTGVNMATPQPVGQQPVAAPAVAEPAVVSYAAINGNQAGPLSEEELSRLIDREIVDGDTLLWRAGLSGWSQAKNIPEVYKIILLKR